MQRTRHYPLIAVTLAVITICLCFGLAACAPQETEKSTASSAGSSTTAVSSEAGAYESDEQCLSCHGGSYESLAETTADLGDWNPHAPIHGGYNSCDNCHAKDKEITNNYCEKCHTYQPGAASA